MTQMEHLTTEPRTEAERVVLGEAGGKNVLGLSLILLMRASGLNLMQATAIARACRWASVEGNVPNDFIGTFYRQDLIEMLRTPEEVL